MRIMDRVIKTPQVQVTNTSGQDITFAANNGMVGIKIKPGEMFISDRSSHNPNPFRVRLTGSGKFVVRKLVAPAHKMGIWPEASLFEIASK